MMIRRKLFALVMSAVLVLTLLPTMAFAAEDQDVDGAAVTNEAAQAVDDTAVTDEEEPAVDEDAVTNEEEQAVDEDAAVNEEEQPIEGTVVTKDAQAEDASTYPVPVEVYYWGGDQGIVGTNELREPGNPLYKGIYTNNHYVGVTYSDGSEKEFECLDYSYKDSQGKTVKGQGFILHEGDGTADPSLESSFVDVYLYEEEKVVFKEGENKVKIQVNVPYTVKDEKTGKVVTEWTVLYTTTFVKCTYYKPAEIKFIPAKGFKPDVYVGYNYINEETFYGKGNAFEVFYKETPEDPDAPWFGYTVTFNYVKKKASDGSIVEGFYEDGNINKDRLDLSEGMECELKKGSNKITLPYSEFVPVLNKTVKINFTYNLVASKVSAYANWTIFSYTGKNISKKAFLKKLVVRNSLGKKIPQSAYTVQWKKHKKMGWYTVTIKFKDKSKYIPSITADFGIGPKAPKITKITKGKKKLKVRWKKLTKKQLKKIDGAYIEISTDKHFLNNFKRIKVSKKQLRKKTKTIKKLKKNTKYYVRMYTYKKIKQGGETFQMWSPDSNVKTKKTKK